MAAAAMEAFEKEKQEDDGEGRGAGPLIWRIAGGGKGTWLASLKGSEWEEKARRKSGRRIFRR